jgi:hypothetical protein
MLFKTPNGNDTVLLKALRSLIHALSLPLGILVGLGVGAFLVWMPFEFLFWLGRNDIPSWVTYSLVGGLVLGGLILASIVQSAGETPYRRTDADEFIHTEDYNYDRFNNDD